MIPPNEDAVIMCTGCPGSPSSVKAKGGKTVKVDGKTVLVETDTKISAFKPNCIAIPPPAPPRACNPMLVKWAMVYNKHKPKGKNVLLYPNLIPCTFGPGVVTMTAPGTKTNKIMAAGGETGDESCDWKDCESKHPYKITYANNGVVVRKDLDEWMHPSSIYQKRYRTTPYPNGKNYDNYVIRRHHVIPVKVFEKLDKLSHNLKLLGYDINNEFFNGMALAFYDADVVWHDLQPHRGNHQGYSDRVENKMKEIQDKCVTYCTSGKQTELWEEVQKKVKLFREHILNWRWIITGSCSKAARKTIFIDKSDNNSAPATKGRKYFI